MFSGEVMMAIHWSRPSSVLPMLSISTACCVLPELAVVKCARAKIEHGAALTVSTGNRSTDGLIVYEYTIVQGEISNTKNRAPLARHCKTSNIPSGSDRPVIAEYTSLGLNVAAIAVNRGAGVGRIAGSEREI